LSSVQSQGANEPNRLIKVPSVDEQRTDSRNQQARNPESKTNGKVKQLAQAQKKKAGTQKPRRENPRTNFEADVQHKVKELSVLEGANASQINSKSQNKTKKQKAWKKEGYAQEAAGSRTNS
jgi:hypothetical protein